MGPYFSFGQRRSDSLAPIFFFSFLIIDFVVFVFPVLLFLIFLFFIFAVFAFRLFARRYIFLGLVLIAISSTSSAPAESIPVGWSHHLRR